MTRAISTSSGKLARSGSDSLQRGAVIVEFILVAPFVLFLVGYVVYLSAITQAQQIAMTLSREVATRVYRECADLTILSSPAFDAGGNDMPIQVDQNNTMLVIMDCVNAARNDSLAYWNTLKPASVPAGASPSFQIRVIRYNLQLATPTDECGSASNSLITCIFFNGFIGSCETPLAPRTVCARNRLVQVDLQFPITLPIDARRLISTFSSFLSGSTEPPAVRTITERTII
jgi:hypothetical protein